MSTSLDPDQARPKLFANVISTVQKSLLVKKKLNNICIKCIHETVRDCLNYTCVECMNSNLVGLEVTYILSSSTATF